MTNINFEPNTIFCSDNLPVLRNMNSECVDLIYLDPPFNKKKKFTAPIGSSAQGAGFSDYFSTNDVEEAWLYELFDTNKELYYFLYGIRRSNRSEYNYAYLVYMSMRLIECQRILKETGSIYLHCDHTMSHYIKLMMDLIFGEEAFRNDIVWCYSKWTNTANYFQRNHDNLFFYVKSKGATFNKLFGEMTPAMQQIRARGYNGGSSQGKKILRVYDRENPKAIAKIESGEYDEVYYLDDAKDGAPIPDYWDIPILGGSSKERTGYPTQKPLDLLKRIISASSNVGDLVLDPFCGCATACVAAQALQRKWVGIDVSIKAWELMQTRMAKEIPNALQDDKYHFRTDLPTITERHSNERKYLYVITRTSAPGKYKIGYATDAKSRVNAMKTSVMERDHEIVYTVKTEHFEACEKHIHKKFNADHEWVTADVNAVIKSIQAYLKRADAV